MIPYQILTALGLPSKPLPPQVGGLGQSLAASALRKKKIGKKKVRKMGKQGAQIVILF